MAPKSRLEIDFQRLLHKCENDMADHSEILSPQSWRLEKYVEALEDKLAELHKLTVCQPIREDLIQYKKRVKFLKGVVETEKLKTPVEKLVATQILSPTTANNSGTHGLDKSKEIFHQTQSKHGNAVRDELFSGSQNELRKRVKGSSDDVDTVIKHHHDVQEKVALEMVALAKNLKENCAIASEIIKQDVNVLEGSAKTASGNFENLKQSSDKLTDFVRRSCQYWLWIMLALVSMTFLWIVVFIRMFPKRIVATIEQ
ncbi:Vesicle transport protein USE1 [Halotydeus destructor]|nr:Vesicle transport protein USE1 [Halotydeus destructor]